jgi:hypothetical protein
MSGLRSSGGQVDAWVLRAGMPFNNGHNHIRVSFNQG